MDADFCTQSQTLPSTLSTATETSQEFSPPKIKHQNSYSHLYSSSSTQPSQMNNLEDSDSESPKLAKKPVFTIIRGRHLPQKYESCNNKKAKFNSSKIPLTKDFGSQSKSEKSLGDLSKKLLMMFGRVEECVISLDTATQELGVERRRIYDIINILESLGVVYRRGKNSYQWKGLKSIYETLATLEQENLTKISNITPSETFELEDDDNDKTKSNTKKEKSLGILATGFIKLFLSWQGVISLEQAGKKLSFQDTDQSKIKTKIRRLYDIANVLSSVGLIRKICLESKKPAYEWTGVPGLDAFIDRLNRFTDEKDIFCESTFKSKTKIPNISKAKVLQEKTQIGIEAENNIQKQQENSILNQNTVENLLSLMLSLYQRQSSNKSLEEENLTSALLKSSGFGIPKLQRQTSSPGNLGMSNLGFTPTIRKSVSIIQRPMDNSEAPTSGKKSPKTNGFVLADKTNNSGLKRAPLQSLDSLERRTVKKMHSSSDAGNNENNVIRPLIFPNKENFSMIARSDAE